MSEWMNENSQIHSISAELKSGVEAAIAELLASVGYLPPGTVIMRQGMRELRISIVGYQNPENDVVQMQFNGSNPPVQDR